MTTQTILFIDLDGTILVNPFLSAVFPHYTQHFGHDLTLEFLAEQQVRLAQPHADPVWVMDWDDICVTVARRHDWELPLPVHTLVTEYSRPPFITVIDEADIILRQIVQPKRKLVVASMGLHRYQMPVLRGLGIAELFDDFLMPDITGALKTDPRFYAKYADNPALKINVGDNLIDDVIRPHQFGHHTIQVTPIPPANSFADREIQSLAELPAAIAALEAENT